MNERDATFVFGLVHLAFKEKRYVAFLMHASCPEERKTENDPSNMLQVHVHEALSKFDKS